MNEKELTRIERERILLAKVEDRREQILLTRIAERDRRIATLERRIRKVLMYAYLIGCATGFVCGLIFCTLF